VLNQRDVTSAHAWHCSGRISERRTSLGCQRLLWEIRCAAIFAFGARPFPMDGRWGSAGVPKWNRGLWTLDSDQPVDGRKGGSDLRIL